ncbi:hypothetical protein EI94DRAFT_93983 [Lactarius quietus]|nr:hypothetical protein EI94DRAFT_93983 [Lactarius quietus]
MCEIAALQERGITRAGNLSADKETLLPRLEVRDMVRILSTLLLLKSGCGTVGGTLWYYTMALA